MANATAQQTTPGANRVHGKRDRSRGDVVRGRGKAPGPSVHTCKKCAEMDPALACKKCIEKAYQRHSSGHSVEAIAKGMNIDTDRVWLLLEAHEVLLELDALKVETVPTEGLRALIRAACWPANANFGMRDDVEHIEHGRMSDGNLENLVALLRASTSRTLSAIAAELGYRDVGALGRKVGATSTGRQADGTKRYRETISVEEASKIVRALGLAPAQCDHL